MIISSSHIARSALRMPSPGLSASARRTTHLCGILNSSLRHYQRLKVCLQVLTQRGIDGFGLVTVARRLTVLSIQFSLCSREGGVGCHRLDKDFPASAEDVVEDVARWLVGVL